MGINADQRRGSQQGFEKTSGVNQLQFLVNQELQKLQTSFIARVDLCESQEEKSGATYVSITPMVSQSDTEGSALPMVSIPKIPHTRYQHGIAAIVIDPVPGDLVAIGVSKNDITNIKAGVTEPVTAGSFRHFSQSDSIALHAVHTKTPEVYIVLRQDKTILIHAPQGIKVETEQNIEEQIGVDRTINIESNRTEQIGGNSTITIQGNQSITISSNSEITISGNSNINVSGDVSLSINGNLSVKASKITCEAASTTFIGDVAINGSLSQGSGKSRGGGNAVFANDVTANGTITGNVDVIGGGISLKNHVHGNGNDGQNTTGPQ